jgi:hypothetical protein
MLYATSRSTAMLAMAISLRHAVQTPHSSPLQERSLRTQASRPHMHSP